MHRPNHRRSNLSNLTQPARKKKRPYECIDCLGLKFSTNHKIDPTCSKFGPETCKTLKLYMKNKVLRDPTTCRVGLEPKNLAQWSGWAWAKGKKTNGFHDLTRTRPNPTNDQVKPSIGSTKNHSQCLHRSLFCPFAIKKQKHELSVEAPYI